MLPSTSPSSTPTRATPSSPCTTRSSRDVLPAPGALIRFTTLTPVRSKSARLPRGMLLFASSASSTTLTLVRCTRPPLDRRDLLVALDLGQLTHHQQAGDRQQRDQDNREHLHRLPPSAFA